jgi:hypothetical protein
VSDLNGFHELGERLVARLADRLSPDDRADLDLYLREEEAVMANLLAGILVQDQVPIRTQERDMLVELLGYFPPGTLHSPYYRRILDRDATLAALNVVDEP